MLIILYSKQLLFLGRPNLIRLCYTVSYDVEYWLLEQVWDNIGK